MTEPTDAEIVAVMRDGYKCRYNDEADHGIKGVKA